MSKKLNDLKLTLLLKELALLDLEKDYNDKFIEYYKPLFFEEANKNGYEPKIITGETFTNTQSKKQTKYEVTDSELRTIKNLFRQIAKISHPDKTKNIYKNKLYEESQIAYDENNLLVLYKIAKKLNIDIELDVNNLILVEKIVNEKKKEISSVGTTFLWMWANAETEEKKDEIIKQFIKTHG